MLHGTDSNSPILLYKRGLNRRIHTEGFSPGPGRAFTQGTIL